MAEKIAIMLSNFVLEKYDRRFLKKQETKTKKTEYMSV